MSAGQVRIQGQVRGQIADVPADLHRLLWQSMPRIEALPAVGRISSITVRIVVVLPAPFGPRKPNTSPRWTSRSRSISALTSP